MVDIEDLPPEERIKRLKELQKKKKAEISDAERLLKESEEQLRAKHAWEEKVPVPEIMKEEGETPEEKELLRVHRGRVDELIVDDTEGLAGLVKNEKIPNSTGDEINYRLNNDDRQEAYSMQDEQERGYGNSEQHFEENHGKDIMQRSNQPYSSSTQAEENDKMRNLYRSE
ncbi:hypothetical protein HOI26_05165 [Candidatus Woesearchaeota archaeon]|jgi:hypothetical protein|nr:hypothetical protein [Candidatus Woesearchaeota archaeon]MBT5740458.1 hypothetical protein [Candidatus Woesearchaeota archaeon]